jgi:hypothetical protein
MRYYKIEIQDEGGQAVNRSNGSTISWTTHPNGVNAPPDPGALMCEFDLPVADFAAPMGEANGCYVRLYGISITDINQAQDLVNKNIAIYGGMGKGLPLAKPAQSGLLLQGRINQSFGNWQGRAMTLDLIITTLTPTAGTAAAQPIVMSWKANQPLATAIRNTMQTAFPNYTLDIKISDRLVLANDEPGYWATMPQFAAWVQVISRKIINLDPPQPGPWGTAADINGKYPGVSIVLNGKVLTVTDGSTASSPRELAYEDLIGQPTWIASFSIQVQTVLRADLQVGNFIRLPPGPTIVTAQSMDSYTKLRNGLIFKGDFQIKALRHIGNSRDPSGSNWVTVIEAFKAEVNKDNTSSIPTAAQPGAPTVPEGDVKVGVSQITAS